jgi:hypothetical protein
MAGAVGHPGLGLPRGECVRDEGAAEVVEPLDVLGRLLRCRA